MALTVLVASIHPLQSKPPVHTVALQRLRPGPQPSVFDETPSIVSTDGDSAKGYDQLLSQGLDHVQGRPSICFFSGLGTHPLPMTMLLSGSGAGVRRKGVKGGLCEATGVVNAGRKRNRGVRGIPGWVCHKGGPDLSRVGAGENDRSACRVGGLVTSVVALAILSTRG